MSKQLLHTYQSSVVTVGLNDRAFVLINNNDASTAAAIVLELMTNKDTVDATKSKETESIDKGDGEQQSKKKKKKNPPTPTNNPHEIQAVCCTQLSNNSTIIWLAVSREDKSLSLYTYNKNSSSDSIKELYPTVTYKLAKRARCLSFASVPSSSSSSTDELNVIIAGDLSGDAYAFPLVSAATNDSDKSTRRLLLGHTASILTGLNVVPSSLNHNKQQKEQFILTSDRDEKIRITNFPQTYNINGYLLGHTSFISTMDAISTTNAVGSSESSSRPLCITGSGDGTVRLWNYATCKEIGMVPVVIKKCSEEEDEDDRKMPANDEEDEMNEDSMQEEDNDGEDEDFSEEEEEIDSHKIAVPLSVSLSPDANNIVVARDGMQSIDIHPIPAPPTSTTSSSMLSQLVSLHKKQTVECPSQPLAVRWLNNRSILVLTREPTYLLHYQCNEEKEPNEYKNVSSASPFITSLQKVIAGQSIIIPNDIDDLLKLQKNKVSDSNEDGEGETPKGGLHWNDIGRKETAKLAESRRRKRRRENEQKEKKEEESKNESMTE